MNRLRTFLQVENEKTASIILRELLSYANYHSEINEKTVVTQIRCYDEKLY
jgi:hypothetical protein